MFVNVADGLHAQTKISEKKTISPHEFKLWRFEVYIFNAFKTAVHDNNYTQLFMITYAHFPKTKSTQIFMKLWEKNPQDILDRILYWRMLRP